MNRIKKHTDKRAGFTLVEMIIVAPIVMLVIGAFINAIVFMTGNVLATREASSQQYNIQEALNRIRSDISYSENYLATNNTDIQSPQGYDDSTESFHNASTTQGNALILSAYMTASNPLGSTQDYIYSTSPNSCNSDQVTANPKNTYNIVYFVKNHTLWRRVLMPSNYLTAGCSKPWQQPSCRPGQTGAFCASNDEELVNNISDSNGFNIKYYSASSTADDSTAVDVLKLDSTRQAALSSDISIEVSINTSQTTAGRNVNQSGTGRFTILEQTGKLILDGLVLNLDAGDTKSYAKTGTTWTDISGNNNNGTLYNGVNYSDSYGGALSFDGVDDYVNVPNSSSISMTSAITISTWFKSSVGKSGLGIITKGPASDDYDYMLYLSSAGNKIALFLKNSVGTVANYDYVYNWTGGTWNNYAATFSGGRVSLYQNGVLITTATTTLADIRSSSNSLRIGAGWSPGVYFDGLISQVGIYNRALSSSEIKQNYNAMRERYNL